MCGIAGLITRGRVDPSLVKTMTDPIAHRGPDDEGIWLDEQASVGLGHRRLSIIDLSPHGHQPMPSHGGRYVLAYNGEIYNHAELRAELDSQGLRAWRGHSDTETLLEAIAAWGLGAALKKSVGMFALALWDRHERKLYLARDRFGEKPLYYGWVGGDFLFASELKAMRTHPRFDNRISRTALAAFASRIYIPTPLSIFDHIYKLEPGCILEIDGEGAVSRPDGPPLEDRAPRGLKIDRYWSYRRVMAEGMDDPIGDEAEALAQLQDALSTSIRIQSVADVPVGAFLSGGIDSSTVVGLYQKFSSTSIRTFSIGFEEEGFNEAEHAKAVARHFGTDHHERYVSVREAQQVLPSLPAMYDEPFADPSQIPTHIVSRFAREQVAVALSGDGGDELFGGYTRYVGAPRLWSRMSRVPRRFRNVVGRSFAPVPAQAWNKLGAMLPPERRPGFLGAKMQKAFRMMGHVDGFEGVFDAYSNDWHGQGSPVLSTNGQANAYPFDLDLGRAAPEAVRMMYGDVVSYLPDDILCKVDRASMAVSLETRVPFLDHRVAAVAARIPLEMKMQQGKGKIILRKLLYGMAPAELFERPKAGFGMPVGQWITGELRPWAEELLRERRLREEGFFDPRMVLTRWNELLTGVRDAGFSMWAILMFQAWLEEFNKSSSASEPKTLVG